MKNKNQYNKEEVEKMLSSLLEDRELMKTISDSIHKLFTIVADFEEVTKG